MAKINVSKLGIKKPIEIKLTIKNQDKADEMLIKLLQLSVNADVQSEKKDLKPSEVIAQLEQERTFTKEAFGFLKDILKLTDKQIEDAKDELDFNELGQFLNYLIGRIKGQSEEQLAESLKEEEKDPKKG